ncbi:MAG TPA: hypothetical protein VEV43_07670 [Actinomycetota bacterium]|nr:hypothetical protein [Actinomycetota bacterium]
MTKVAIVSNDPAVRDAAATAFATAPPEWTVELRSDEPDDADAVVYGSDVGAGDGIVFDRERPGEALRAVEARVGRGRVYAVVGAAGGVGVTSLAVHLAAAMAPSGYAELAGASSRLGLPGDALTWLPRDDDRSLQGLPVAGGLRVLRAPDPCPSPEAFPLREARASFGRLVLDLGSRRDLDAVLTSSSAAVLVTTPTRPAALAARSLTEAFPEARWIVVVNRLGPGGQIMRGGLEQLLGRPIGIELPCCPALRDAEDEARLLAGSWRRWTRGVARLAKALSSC